MSENPTLIFVCNYKWTITYGKLQNKIILSFERIFFVWQKKWNIPGNLSHCNLSKRQINIITLNDAAWKFEGSYYRVHRVKLFIAKMLREINFEDSWSAKSTILTHLEPLNFDFYEFLHFLKAEIHHINKISSPKVAKTDSSRFSKIGFT